MSIKNSRDLVIKASKAATDNVYFIGPYGARVSFASQQKRALNLIWALRETGEWPKQPRPRAAVVGGGIAGLMVAAALRLQDCSVWLFEAEGSLLGQQRHASHRHVHPTINFWPEQPLAWTTCFPFFDWYATSCDRIIAGIEQQWSSYFEGKMAEVKTGWKLKRYKAGAGGSAGRIILKFEEKVDQVVDLLFIATGFGPERDLKDPRYRSYWEVDRIDAMSREKGKQFVVSGTGDGGLIDALRLTYTGFMSDEIALQYLKLVDCAALQAIVSDVEKKAEPMAPDRRSVHYHDRYTEIARDQDTVAKKLLPDLADGKNPITLIGQHPRPFDIGAAPIHKLILAWSLDRGRILYRQGSVRRSKGGYWLDRPDGTTERLDADAVIVRHGAVPPVSRFLSKEDREALEVLQRQLGDYLDIGEFEGAKYFDRPDIAPSRSDDFPRFVRSRASLAQGFISERFDLSVRTPTEGAVAGFELVDDRDEDGDADRRFGPVPPQIFGIPLGPGAKSHPIDELVQAV